MQSVLASLEAEFERYEGENPMFFGCARGSNKVAPGYSEPGHSESRAIMNGKSRKVRMPPDSVDMMRRP